MVGLTCTGEGCGGALPVPCAAEAGIASRYDLPADPGACGACGAAMPASQWNAAVLPELQQARRLYEAGCAALGEWERGGGGTEESARQAVGQLRESARIRRRLLHPHNQAVGASEDALALACHAEGDLPAAARHLERSLRIAEHNFPRGSTNTAFQALKVAALLEAEARRGGGGVGGSAAAAGLQRGAVEVLQLHFGGAAAQAALTG